MNTMRLRLIFSWLNRKSRISYYLNVCLCFVFWLFSGCANEMRQERTVREAIGTPLETILELKDGQILFDKWGGAEFEHSSRKGQKHVGHYYFVPVVATDWNGKDPITIWAICPDEIRCKSPDRWVSEMERGKVEPKIARVVSTADGRVDGWEKGIKAIEDRHGIKTHEKAVIVLLEARATREVRKKRLAMILKVSLLGSLMALAFWRLAEWIKRKEERERELRKKNNEQE